MQKLPSQVIWSAALTAALAAAPAWAASPESGPVPGGPRVFTPWDKPAPPKPPDSPELRALGERVFKGACIGCHGEKGDGEGREGRYLLIPPRDFTAGAFIIRTTPSGSLPRDEDLFRSIRRGFRPEVGMPAFTWLTDRELWAVIGHVKTFSDRWKTEEVPPPVPVPAETANNAESAKRGATIYKELGCVFCHGEGAQGDGVSAATLTYDTGKPIRPANLTRSDTFKGGDAPADIFQRITNGMDGTPMPTFADSLTVEQRWDLVHFILSLNAGPRGGRAGTSAR